MLLWERIQSNWPQKAVSRPVNCDQTIILRYGKDVKWDFVSRNINTVPSLAAVLSIKLDLRSFVHSGTLVRADRHPRPRENRHDRHPRRHVKLLAGIAARYRITAARDSASMCPITLTINSQKLGRSNEQTRWESAVNLPKRRPRLPPCCRGWRPLPSCDDPQWLIRNSIEATQDCCSFKQCITVFIFQLQIFNTLRPTQNGRHFADDTFKWIFLKDNLWISFKISLKFVP